MARSMPSDLPRGRRFTDPLSLVTPEAPAPCLAALAGTSLLSVRDLTRVELVDLLRVAASLQASSPALHSRALSGTILLTAFFEASTRTRLSFESAAHRLGASVMSIPDAKFSSVLKGESLADTGVMLNGYADVVVMRHTAEESMQALRASEFDIPLVNAGNGCDEHPTQAMADWYALLKWRPELIAVDPPARHRISLGLFGSPARMRSLRSFLLMTLLFFPTAVRDVIVVSDAEEPLDAELRRAVDESGVNVTVTTDPGRRISDLDVIYQNSLTLVGEEYQVLKSGLRIDRTTPLKPNAVVMHPLARLDELGSDLDDTPHNLYFDQARGAVFVRQALLLALLGRQPGEPETIYASDRRTAAYANRVHVGPADKS